MRIESAGGVPKAVDVTVSERVTGNVPGVGRRVDRVLSWSRAGATYSATLVQTAFRPVDIGGARGAAAVVAAAEAQIGWPYVWGGESRAEGGFDCSGLIDYAYGAAGTALPGRPTAAGLWQMSEHISEAELAPGDLVFLGAPSNAPYHVGMYVGGGMTVVAPHTGAVVAYEALAANPWDGFGRLLKGPPASDPVESRVEAAARRYGVPPNVVSAELQHWPDRDPDRVAAALARSMRAHDHDLMSALTEQLGGDASAAAVIIRTASGPALGAGFSATIELLPRQHPRSSSDLPPLAGPGRGSIISNLAGTLTNGVEWVGDLRHGKGLRLPEHLGHGWNLGLDMFGIVPGIVGAVAQVASAARDIYNVVSDLMVVREVAQTAGRWARVLRFANIAIWLLQALMGGYAAYRARSWRGRIYNGVMCAAGIAGVAAGAGRDGGGPGVAGRRRGRHRSGDGVGQLGHHRGPRPSWGRGGPDIGGNHEAGRHPRTRSASRTEPRIQADRLQLGLMHKRCQAPFMHGQIGCPGVTGRGVFDTPRRMREWPQPRNPIGSSTSSRS